MKYGNDCCIGTFVDGKWVDSTKDKFDKGMYPEMQGFIYSDDGTDGWILLNDFSIRVYDEVITVKKGFDFDGASIWKIFWTSIGHPLGLHKLIGALIHDGMYATNKKSKIDSDNLFLELLEAFEETWACRNKCWLAVRGFGGFVYPKTQKELDEYKDFVVITKLHKESEVIEPLLS